MAMSIKQLNSAIASWGKRSAKVVKTEAQNLLVECAFHAFTDKNVDPFTNLVNAAEGLDRKTLVSWIIKHAPAIWVQETGAFKWNKAFEGSFDREFLAKKAWWEKTPPTTQISSEIDLLTMLRRFIKRAEAEVALEISVEADGVTSKAKRKVEHAGLLDAVKALANDTEYADKQVRAEEVAVAVEATK